MAKRAFKYVGHSVKRVDGVEKVTGAAKYVGDITVPGMLYGKILRSTYPHARIRSIDASQAEALPGVIAVLTAADIADLNPIYNGRPVIAMKKVHYVGEPVAAVAAEDLATAEEALALIHVDYEELPTVTNIEAAIKPGAPLVHEDKGRNIGTHEKVDRGNADEGFAQSDVIAEDHSLFRWSITMRWSRTRRLPITTTMKSLSGRRRSIRFRYAAIFPRSLKCPPPRCA